MADGGESGMRALAEQTFDVMIVDIFMPHMRGFESIRMFHERAPDIPLIAMSGYGQPEDVRRSEAAGFDRHLTKPVDPARLASALRDIRWRESFGSRREVRLDPAPQPRGH